MDSIFSKLLHARTLLEQSAEPYDKACMIIRDLSDLPEFSRIRILEDNQVVVDLDTIRDLVRDTNPDILEAWLARLEEEAYN